MRIRPFWLLNLLLIVLIFSCSLLIADDVPTVGEEETAAVPAVYLGAVVIRATPQDKDGKPGYSVESTTCRKWVSKELFEKTYFLIGPGDGDEAGKITDDTVDRFVSSIESKQLGNRTIAAAAQTVIGFDVTETATCAETYAFEADKAEDIATKRAKAMVWTFLGFTLQWANRGIDQ